MMLISTKCILLGMAGKNQSQRIKIIDKYLRTGRKFSWEQLQEHLIQDLLLDDISERSIKADISEMRKGFMGLEPAPIKNEMGQYFYEKDFNLFGSPIKDQETYTLINALDILNQFPEFEHSEQVSEIIETLKKALDITEDSTSSTVIDFEKTEYPAGVKWISKLYAYVKEKQPLHLDYQPFNTEEFRANIVPLLLKEFNGRWFLIAWELTKSQYQNYALDRINSMAEYNCDLSTIMIDFNAERYFEHLIGVTKNDEGALLIRFKTSDYIKFYMLTKKLHHSQELVDNANNIFEINVEINNELIAKLLSFGEDLVVLYPQPLVDRIKEKVDAMSKQY
jgi:predicted DNA-binding transcriptional regulator YafY